MVGKRENKGVRPQKNSPCFGKGSLVLKVPLVRGAKGNGGGGGGVKPLFFL